MLGRNLEGLVTRAQDIKQQWKDQFVSVEHLVLAFADDARFGRQTLQSEGLDKAALENAIKEMRGSNRVTDQVSSDCLQVHPSGGHVKEASRAWVIVTQLRDVMRA